MTEKEFDELRPSAFAIAYRMLGSVSEAEDVVQEGFLRLHRARAGGEPGEVQPRGGKDGGEKDEGDDPPGGERRGPGQEVEPAQRQPRPGDHQEGGDERPAGGAGEVGGRPGAQVAGEGLKHRRGRG